MNKQIILKYQLQRGTINLNYMMVHIQYQIFKIVLRKKHETAVDGLPIRIYVNKIENRITFVNINTGIKFNYK